MRHYSDVPWENGLEAGRPVVRLLSRRPMWEERHFWVPWGHLNVIFSFACSTYAPVKSFLRVDKEKVSPLLSLLHPHLTGKWRPDSWCAWSCGSSVP